MAGIKRLKALNMNENKMKSSTKSYFTALMVSTVLAGGALAISPSVMPKASVAHAQEAGGLVSAILFNGNSRLKSPVLKAVVKSSTGFPVDDATLQSDIEAIKGAYRSKGRNAAGVSARVISLPSGRVNVVFDIDEGDKSKIASVSFNGNNAFSAYRLSDVVSTHKTNFLSWLRNDDLYDPRRIGNDEQLLRQFYINHGYADAQIASTDVSFNENENAYDIVFNVDEGAKYNFGQISIESSIPGVDSEALSNLLYTEAGDTYNIRDIDKTITALTQRLSGQGLAFADVSPRADRDFQDNTVSLTYYIDEGAKVYIDRIEIEGNTRTRDYVIRREFDMSEGDAYNRGLVRHAKKRVEDLGFFENVEVSTRPGSSDDRVVLVVNVEDKPTGELSLGGGYSSTGGALATVTFAEKNFLGRGQFLKASISAGQTNRSYQLSFTEPYFLGRRLAAGFDLYHTRSEAQNTSSFDFQSSGGTLRLGAPITENLSGRVFYSYDRTAVSTERELNTISLVTQSSLGTFVTSSVGASLTYNTLDNRKLPREGIYAKGTFEFAGVGGDSHFLRGTVRGAFYRPIWEEADIIGVVAGGAGHIQSTSGQLRTTENFFQGSETVRGFAPLGFGPRDIATNEALGGTTYYNATAELQFPLYGFPRSLGLRGAVFVEAGTLYGNEHQGAVAANTSATFNDQSLRASVGASIIWDSPFGPLRVDYAHAFNKKAYDEIQELSFGISSKF